MAQNGTVITVRMTASENSLTVTERKVQTFFVNRDQLDERARNRLRHEVVDFLRPSLKKKPAR